MIGAGYLFGATIEQAVTENWKAASVAMLVAFVMLDIVAWRRTYRLN
jgi:hypothetical protein